MARLIISLDSEDYETPAADDAELWWARTLTRHGLRGSFCLVGELARALRARGRRDVLEAYAPHEISYHSNLHSAHPTHAEYPGGPGLGRRRVSPAGGGTSWSAGGARGHGSPTRRGPANPAIAGDRRWPTPCPGSASRCSATRRWNGRPVGRCVCRQPVLRYHLSLDRFFSDPHGRLERMQQAVSQLLDAHGDGYAVIYTHPCRLYTAAFPDNFTGGKNPPRAEWRPAPLRPAAERESPPGRSRRPPPMDRPGTAARDCRLSQPMGGARPRPHAVAELCSRCASSPGSSHRRRWSGSRGWLSAAEQWSVLVGAAALGEVHLTWPKQVGVSRLLGPVEQPAETTETFQVPIGALMVAARRALELAALTGRIPTAIPLGGATLGPNALLQACARAVPQHFRARWPERASVAPADETPALAHREDFAALRYHNTWSIFPPEFRGEKLLKLAQLQAWTAKPGDLERMKAEGGRMTRPNCGLGASGHPSSLYPSIPRPFDTPCRVSKIRRTNWATSSGRNGLER